MRTGALPLLPAIAALAACATPCGTATPLAPRAAEAVDPRVPVVSPVRSGPVDAQLAARLAALLDQAENDDAVFREAAARAEQLAASAGAAQSESWVAAQQALSLLVEQHGVATRAAAEIDELASGRLERDRWIKPAEQAAISAAAAEVAAITSSQAEVIQRLGDQLAR